MRLKILISTTYHDDVLLSGQGRHRIHNNSGPLTQIARQNTLGFQTVFYIAIFAIGHSRGPVQSFEGEHLNEMESN